MRLENVIDWSFTRDSITVIMSYIGGDLSVNRYKWGHYTKPNVKQWMDELAFVLRLTSNSQPIHLEPPIVVAIHGEFRDKRSTPDTHNLTKVICDSVQQGLGINDRDFRVETGEPAIGDEPKIVITVTNTGKGCS